MVQIRTAGLFCVIASLNSPGLSCARRIQHFYPFHFSVILLVRHIYSGIHNFYAWLAGKAWLPKPLAVLQMLCLNRSEGTNDYDSRPWVRITLYGPMVLTDYSMVIPGGRKRASTIIGRDFPKPVGRAPNRWWPPDEVSSAQDTICLNWKMCWRQFSLDYH